MVPRWIADPPAGFGMESTNKSVTPPLLASPGDTIEVTNRRAYVVLRAWMIHRALQAPSFLAARSSRRRLFQMERETLMHELQQFELNGSTGNPQADAMIKGWLPDVMQHDIAID